MPPKLQFIFPSPETMFFGWDIISQYLPKRWRSTYLLSDGTLGLFINIASTGRVGRNPVYINDTCKAMIQLLQLIKSKHYREIVANVFELANINSELIIQRLSRYEFVDPVIRQMTPEDAAILLFIWTCTKCEWPKIDHRTRTPILHKKDFDENPRTDLISSVKNLSWALSSVELSHMSACKLITHIRPLITKQDLVIFDPNPPYGAPDDKVFNRLKASDSWMFYHNKFQGLKSLYQQLWHVFSIGCKFVVILRNTDDILETIHSVHGKWSEKKIEIHPVELPTYTAVNFIDVYMYAETHEKYQYENVPYLIIRNFGENTKTYNERIDHARTS